LPITYKKKGIKGKKKRAYAKMERDADEMKNYLVTNVVPDGWNTTAK